MIALALALLFVLIPQVSYAADTLIWSGERPDALISSGEDIYAAIYRDGRDTTEILRISPDGTVLGRFEIDGRVRGMAFSNGELLVSHSDRITSIRNESILDIATGLINPGSIAALGDRIFVAVDGGVLRIGRHGEDLAVNTGKHIFLEIWTVEHGISRRGPGPRIMIDFPTYSLDDGVLRSIMPVDGVEGADLIVGTGISLSGDLGGGASSMLSAVKLPYTAEVSTVEANETDRFGILGIEDGCVHMAHMGEIFRLCPGESRSFTRNTSSPDGSLDIMLTTTVTNHGFVQLETPGVQEEI
ncbi:MAG: hypothetical protein NQU42_03115 [Methanothrix sp.]|uniref:hypothetical protein n=1 Tax=Methanothrix sp. TaxID=90426 RepID=UPI0025EBCDE2|nr:hypothetical protein [Methanothrix sp.]MCQ8903074.1 hypothetical protein [Methanothrix sp.]